MLWANKNLLNLKCSRLDLAVDDYGKELDFNQLKNAIESHSYSGFRKSRTVMNHGGKYTGWTVYLGARESEFMVRIYDKFAESKGAIDSIRWEAEIKGKMANNLFPVLLECPGNEAMYQAKLIKYAIGGISFIQKVSKNIGRCPLLDWWENWLKYLSCSPLRIFVKRVKTTLSNTKSWIYRSVAKSLAMLEEGLGVYYFEHFVNELLLDGKSRLTNLDKLRIEDYQTYTHVC
jgi:DNA relaxase NicK